jgi:hypothetical protein
MATSKLEQAIYLAENLPQGEYDVDDYEVWARARGGKRGKSLIDLEYDRYSNCNVMKINTDYELLMSSGVEIIRHLLAGLRSCRVLLQNVVLPALPQPHDDRVEAEYRLVRDFIAELAALDDYDPPAA